MVTTHGVVNYYESGEGSPLILLHATPRSALSFHKLIPHLGKFHRVIAPDTLGFGLSGPPPKSPSIDLLADSIKQLLQKIGVKKCCAFGLHTGNKIAAALAAKAPKIVGKLIICGMTHSIIPEKTARIAAIENILLMKKANNMKLSDQERVEREKGKHSEIELYQANYAFDLSEELGKVLAPTLIIELTTPNEKHLGIQAHRLAEYCNTPSTAILEGSDREFLEKKPEDLVHAILTFIQT